jgi:carbon monoxide dehydrogenase subunit G
MTEAFRTEETLAVSSDRAWAALTDLAHAPEWMPGIDSMSVAGTLREGANVTFHTRGKERGSEVIQFAPGRSMTLRSVQGPVTADYLYNVDPVADAASRVTLTADVTTSGGMKLLAPIIRSAIAKADGGQLSRFKAFVERKQ